MKREINKLLYLLLVSITVFSCANTGEDETFNLNEKTVAYFSTAQQTLLVREEGANVLTVSVGASAAINKTRTFTIEVDDSSTAVEGVDYVNLNLSNLTIAAGEQFGEFTVNAGSFDNATLSGKNLVLNLVDVEDSNLNYRLTQTIKIIKFCPLEASFTGSYLIEELTPYVDGPTLDTGTVVELYEIEDFENQRGFLTANYIDYCSTPNEFIISFVCGFIEFPGEGNQSNCTCGGTLLFSNAEIPETYDPADDSEFLITFTNDPLEDCLPVQQTTYRFTKQ